MEFKQLEAFVAVVEYNSFSEAARHLFLTQPTISAHIRSLEQELNSRLIIRTTKKLTITQRGYQLYDCAATILNMRNNLIAEFTGQHLKIIELGVSTIPSSYMLPELLQAFKQKIPDIYFHAWQSDSQEAINKVLDGSVDLSLVGNSIEDETCCFIPFCHDDLVIATPVTDLYLQYENSPPPLEEFLKNPIIMRENGSGTKKEIDNFLETKGLSPAALNVVARMNDLESIKKSIANGLGISILSARSARDLADSGQILLFPLDKEYPSRTFYIVYSKNRILKPHVKQFIQFVQAFYQ